MRTPTKFVQELTNEQQSELKAIMKSNAPIESPPGLLYLCGDFVHILFTHKIKRYSVN